jgi:hypothetical protein
VTGTCTADLVAPAYTEVALDAFFEQGFATFAVLYKDASSA